MSQGLALPFLRLQEAWGCVCMLPSSYHLPFVEELEAFSSAKQLGKRASDVIFSVVISSVALRDPKDCSTPGLSAHHQLAEFIQTHVHGVSDAIQPSHPLSSPSPPAFNLSWHQRLFK